MAVALFALVFDITVALYFTRKAKLGSVVDNIEAWIQEWRESGGLDQYIFEENGEWQLDARIGKLIDLVGSRIALSLRQSMFQQMGVDAKLQKGVDKAVGLDVLNGSGIGGVS